MELISLSEREEVPGEYEVLYENGVKLGELGKDVDGFYYFWPELRGGSWEPTVMRAIADKMDELNKPWEDQIARDLAV